MRHDRARSEAGSPAGEHASPGSGVPPGGLVEAPFTWVEGPVPYLRCEAIAAPHGFSTRLGGVGKGPYATLNLARSAGDDPHTVERNKERFRDALALPRLPLTLHQVHSAHGIVVTAGTEVPTAGEVQGDWLATDLPDLPVGVYAADCVPILVHDPRTGAVAALHSGWRGTARGVVRVAIDALSERFGTDPREVVAAVGPAIGGCCYQVGPEVVEGVLGSLALTPDEAESRGIVRRGNDLRLDLPGAIRAQLLAAGLLEASIHLLSSCSSCHPEAFFSYRRDGAASGRMLAVIRALNTDH